MKYERLCASHYFTLDVSCDSKMQKIEMCKSTWIYYQTVIEHTGLLFQQATQLQTLELDF